MYAMRAYYIYPNKYNTFYTLFMTPYLAAKQYDIMYYASKLT